MPERPETEGHTRGLLVSLAVIASGQAVAILIRIVRAKLIAVLLGPSGTGLLSILTNLQQLGNQVAGLGLPMSGVREIAISRDTNQELSRIRRVLAIAFTVQGGLALAAIWAMREKLSLWLLDDPSYAAQIGLSGIAVLVFLLSISQQTLLQGFRRLADLSRVMVLGTLAGSLAGVAAVMIWGMNGLIALVIAEPLAALIVARFYVRKLPVLDPVWPSVADVSRHWWPMVRLGLAFMLAGLATTATLLLLRAFLSRESGLEAAGHFAAAWTISMMYVGFLLDAMGKDYYPRLSEVISDQPACNRLMNDQMLLSLSLGGPILILMVGFAPWVTRLFYSPAFDEAAVLIQWQMAGNAFKIAAWVLSFSIMAAGRGALFMGLEAVFNALLIGVVVLGFPWLGLEIAGVGFLVAYMLYLVAVMVFVRRVSGFRWQSRPLRLFLLNAVSAMLLVAATRVDQSLGAVTAVLFFAATFLVGLRAILSQPGMIGPAASRIARMFEILGWPIRADG